jgi:limonene-1,2-epoxide hydrolase
MSDSNPKALAEEFFDRLSDEDRRESAGELFDDRAVITRPGARFVGENAVEEFLAASGDRYEWADKEFDRWIEADSTAISVGRLYGVDNRGDQFGDVRYVDVFRVENGRIVRLDIWNDLAEEGVVAPASE